ncbi:RNA polymerase sigma factor [Pedobacter cryoconitis]|uniref:RNA polymerase sigma-70 factor (ECF subfamily) n=1 Tax=Pedobacter cryoconitis TaxID=188932 RepID=A0A7X0J6L1_9SPHI|nr:RNA polymerase sigma factor [Pedobacter cryoconitis]MBB6500802.1 RNA polymerase sigma-70 factor (ECF subfamily) [Pedobacter cryoconitis]
MTQTYKITDLLEGCKAGNRKMQEMLYRQTASGMLTVCMRYSRDRMEAEDVLQLGYIKVFQKINEFRGDGSFEGWIRRVMVNTAIENYRKNLRALRVVAYEEISEQPYTDFDFSRMGMQDLLGLIQQLADGYRIVFNMYVMEGYSHQEIAKTLGISEGTSKSQLFRARAILREEIIKMEGTNYATYAG